MLVARNGQAKADSAAALGAPVLTLTIDGRKWTLAPGAGTVALSAGPVPGVLRLSLSAEQFSRVAQNQVSLLALQVARELAGTGGDALAIALWDALWHTLIEGWSCAGEGLAFRDRRGAPLDLTQSFALYDDPKDMAHFLREAGYLHLRGWLDPSDMAAISADMDAARGHYREGDGKSRWAVLRGGTRALVRLQEFVEHSPTTAKILSGPVWRRLREALQGTDRLLGPRFRVA